MRKLRLDELGRDSIDEFRARSKRPITVVLDNVRSGHNVGAVFRTADAFAFEKIVLTGITPRPPHKEINKTAIGATLSMDWSYEEDAVIGIRKLKESGYTIIGVEQTTESVELATMHLDSPKQLALVFGNEVNGISDSILPMLDHCIEIAQYGTKHSLNISVCAGIVMWKFAQMY